MDKKLLLFTLAAHYDEFELASIAMAYKQLYDETKNINFLFLMSMIHEWMADKSHKVQGE